MNLDLGHTRAIIAECAREGLTRQQAAYVLATAWWETNRTMKPVREAYWLDEDWRQRNLRYFPYYGRGFVQLTWRDNYDRAGRVFGVDLVRDPDGALEPGIAVKILVRGMREGWFTGKKLSDYITEGAANWLGARRIINGTDKASKIMEIARQYDVALAAEGYGRKPSILAAILDFLASILRGLKWKN